MPARIEVVSNTHLTQIAAIAPKCPNSLEIVHDEYSEAFVMPRLLQNFPWDRGVNKYYPEAKAASDAWLESLRPFSSKGHKIYNGWDFAFLAATCFTSGSYSVFRSSCDLMNVFFIVDEQTDNEPVDVVKQRCEIAFDAVKNPSKPRPENETILGEITRQFWGSACHGMPTVVAERFERTWRSYLDSVVRQAENRDRSCILTPSQYLHERINNIGTWPCYAMAEHTLGLDIPHEIIEHPTLDQMRCYVSELVALQNDLFSYRKEKLTGDFDYNAITVVMFHLGLDLEGAVAWVSQKHEDTLTNFKELRRQVLEKDDGVFPSWGPELDGQVDKYTTILADTIRGNYEWSWHTQRYFPGDMGREARISRKIVIS